MGLEITNRKVTYESDLALVFLRLECFLQKQCLVKFYGGNDISYSKSLLIRTSISNE
jgi:hypothetical protein